MCQLSKQAVLIKQCLHGAPRPVHSVLSSLLLFSGGLTRNCKRMFLEKKEGLLRRLDCNHDTVMLMWCSLCIKYTFPWWLEAVVDIRYIRWVFFSIYKTPHIAAYRQDFKPTNCQLRSRDLTPQLSPWVLFHRHSIERKKTVVGMPVLFCLWTWGTMLRVILMWTH